MVSLTVRSVTSAIGAEVGGIDLTVAPDDETRDAVLDALERHLVLFFRGQPITTEQHLAFARAFGDLAPAPFGPKAAAAPEITVLDQVAPRDEGGDSWHADNTFLVNPPFASILRGVVIPPVGGDTCWANMYLAYERLSSPMRDLVDGLSAVHDITGQLTKAIANGHSDARVSDMQERYPPVLHPVVRTNPRDGRKALFVNRNWTTRIEGVSPAESDALLTLLYAQVHSPDCQVRFKWEPNAIAFWDNRFVQHYAVPDYTERRVMNRVTLDGDVPR
jgi:taurine dioxygenase